MVDPRRNKERVKFEGSCGEQLSGVLHNPGDSNHKGVVLTHCFTCSKDYKLMVWTGRALAARGFTTLRFDLTGLGKSAGDFSKTTLQTNKEDVLAAARYLGEKGSTARVLLGHSFGGAASVLAAKEQSDVWLVATIATSWDLDRPRQLLNSQNKKELEQDGVSHIEIAGREYALGESFIKNLQEHSLLEIVAGWNKKYVQFHPTEDKLVTLREAEKLFEAAVSPKYFWSLVGADHLVGDEETAEEIASVIELLCQG